MTPDSVPRPPGTRPRHRRPPSVPPGRRLAGGALILAVLAAGSVISQHEPSIDGLERPFVRTGAVGQRVEGRGLDATVLSVRGASKLLIRGQAHDTGGVWVLVRVRLLATSTPVLLGYAAVRDSKGRTYRASDRFQQAIAGGRELQPGIPVTAEIAFEVPVAAASDLRVLLAVPPVLQTMDAMAEIRFRTDAATVRRWAAATDTVTPDAPAASG